MDIVLFITILLAGFYLAWNIGANDVANAMGTSVGSGALTLRRAVIVAAVLEFSGAFFFGSHVSETIQNGIINPDLFASSPRTLVYGMLSALLAAGIWLQIASYYGWPVSTTHSIVGAMVGFGIMLKGYESIYWKEVGFIVSSWILSPILGGFIAYHLFNLIRKKVFYVSDPVEAARKWAPVLTFFVIFILSLIVFFEGLHSVKWEISWIEKMGLVIGSSLIASFISYIAVRRIPSSPKQELAGPIYGPEVTASLEKAYRHLGRVESQTKGEVQYTVSLLKEELSQLNHQIQKKQDFESSHSEYVKVEKIFSYLQIMSACMMAFAHGANDVANAIGPLSGAIAILSTGLLAVEAPIPLWALGLGGVGIVIGLATWGWRVIETIGKKITELTPSRGFAAEFGAATTIVLASRLGLPVSTTHILVGAVIGVGFARGLGAVNLTTTRDIAISWIVTVPFGALLAVLLFYPLQAIFG